ncbi:MAG: DNA ligase [Desulfuromonadaceae bacterium]|nr:DNA ligase [Desulfuromonadaceae bacterium]
MLSDQQKQLLQRSGLELLHLDEPRLLAIAAGDILIPTLSDNELLEFLQVANALYRGGSALISDADYDFIFLAELKARHPHHPYLHSVEPETAFEGKTVELPSRMLSTEKAYSVEEILAWLERIRKAAEDINQPFDRLRFRATPKLDGFAAYDDGERLYTRGDGRRGTDISRVFERGLQVAGGDQRGLGAGEIVVQSSYFSANLADQFENARNFQASVVKEKALEPAVEEAIAAGAVVFYPFAALPCWEGCADELKNQLSQIIDQLYQAVDFDMDGIILEITDEELKQYMGATRHHHRWQIALKQNQETAQVRVLRIIPQTSRSGRVNPVAEVEPTRLSGALIQRATAHHYGMVESKGIGPGALIELTRSGEVIPKIVDVINPTVPDLPQRCPSCDSLLVRDGDYLFCPNSSGCPAQIAHSIEHFFRTLGNIDGFGPATIEKLYAHGVRSIQTIYGLTAEQFETMGFGPKQAENLVTQLLRSRTEAIEDWRFLAAFGVFRMAGGNCERLLRHYPLNEVFELTVDQLVAIEGFADKTAQVVIEGLLRIRTLYDHLDRLGFTLLATPRIDELQASGVLSPLAGKLLVFTGTMQHGSRAAMQAEAKKLGAKVGSAVTGKTDYLITGDEVGSTKLKAAESKGVAILTEQQYLDLIHNS